MEFKQALCYGTFYCSKDRLILYKGKNHESSLNHPSFFIERAGGLCFGREVSAMQKQIAVWIICLGLAILIPNQSQAFEYDVWKSGMSLDEALKLAEINDIPVTYREFNKPLQRGRNHFRTEVLKRAKKTQDLCYRQNLRESTALITLHFTPISKKLSGVWIYWSDADITQQKETILALSQKYGAPLKYDPYKDIYSITPDIRREYDVSETHFFAPDQQNIIVVQYKKETNNILRIFYQNRSLSKQEQAELTTFEQYIKTRYRQQDQNRM